MNSKYLVTFSISYYRGWERVSVDGSFELDDNWDIDNIVIGRVKEMFPNYCTIHWKYEEIKNA
jgi:hypothetical protein